MCVVSMIFDRYPSIEPERWTIPATTVDPFNIRRITIPAATKTALDLLEELIAKAKELDDALGLTDCEDPKKGEWLEAIRKQVREAEIKKIDDRLSK